MKNKIIIRGLVFGTILLFLGTCIIPIINASKPQKTNENPKAGGRTQVIIFSDDFNDNKKNFTKWTEIYNYGYWWEQNQRTEFQLNEYNPNWERPEGIISSPFSVSISSSKSINFSCDMISDINSTAWVGYLYFEITDGINWIKGGYRRSYGNLEFQDSNDATSTILGTRAEGTWSNNIEIFSDRYKVTMDSFNSGWIYDSIFSSNPTLNVKIYITNGGTSPPKYQRSGFDNVYVYGPQAISISITSPSPNTWVSGITQVNGIVESAEGTLELVEVKIDSELWEEAQIYGNTWKYSLDTTKFEDGSHYIVARCFDSLGATALTPEMPLKFDNTGPVIYLLFPINNTITIFGRPFPSIPIKRNIMIGMCTIWVRCIDYGMGEVKGLDVKLFNPRKGEKELSESPVETGVWRITMTGFDTWRFGRCSLNFTSSDGFNNECIYSWEFIKLL